MAMRYYYSNRVEWLYSALRDNLFIKGGSPFAKRDLIVPSPMVKDWLQLQFVRDPSTQLAMGMRFHFLNQSVWGLAGFPKDSLPTREELMLRIESILKEKSVQFKNFSAVSQERWQPVMRFLKLAEDGMVSTKRLGRLSTQLAYYFYEYGLYGGKMIADWETDSIDHWQAELWRDIFLGEDAWNHPSRALQQEFDLKEATGERELHLFCFSYLPPLYLRFLTRLGTQHSLHFYLLSPCQAFWTDIRSDREVRGLQHYWQRKGVNEQELEQLECYMRDRNPLLANFGRLGREFVASAQEGEEETRECYFMPASLIGSGLYESLCDSSELVSDSNRLTENPTLLQIVQADMLLMRNPNHSAPIAVSETDQTIQVHVATSRLREVQILHDQLLNLFASQPLLPQDIIVMAPDITDYVPYIQAVFGTSEQQIPLQLHDVSRPFQGSLIHGFLLILELAPSRWEANALISLFDHPAFRIRHHLNENDIHKIRSWVLKSGIRWGMDEQHREALLQRRYKQSSLLKQSACSTWEHGFHMLLEALPMIVDQDKLSDEELFFEHLPLMRIDLHDAELLGKWIFLVRELWRDLQPMIGGEERTLSEWVLYLENLLQTYLGVSNESKNDAAQYEALLQHFQRLRRSAEKFPQETFSFSSIKRLIEPCLQEKSTTINKNAVAAMHFCSLLPMRTIPGRVVCLLGMNEGAFPRLEEQQSLNLMRQSSQADYIPSRLDYDRYLFLETLLSARDYLIIVYQGNSQQDGQPQGPSLLVAELLSYLDKSCRIGNMLPSQACITKHPSYPYHASYFEQEGKSYSELFFKAAVAHCSLPKMAPHRFIPQLFEVSSYSSPLEEETRKITLDLRLLTMAARNPIENYFRNGLGIYMRDEERFLLKDEEAFKISHLDVATLAKQALKWPLDAVVRMAERRGLLPQGALRSIAVAKIAQKKEEYRQRLEQYEVEPCEMFAIRLCDGCKEPTRHSDGSWSYPPLELIYNSSLHISLIGHIADLSPKGLVTLKEESFAVGVESWPRFLTLASMPDQFHGPFEKQLLLEKNPLRATFSESELHHQWSAFFRFYFYSLQRPIPLLPKWLPLVASGDAEGLERAMKKDLFSTNTPFQSLYLSWLISQQDIPKGSVIIHDLHDLVRESMHPLLSHFDLLEGERA